MIADEVQILTVHPDDDFARRLTLPSVVKSYLIKKIPKGDRDVRAIGSHGTEVILQVRRSAELKEIEALVRYWLVLPGCELTCKIDDSLPTTVGFSDVQGVIEHYYQQARKKDLRKITSQVRTESLQGIELAYVVTKSDLADVWDFATMYDRPDRATVDGPDTLLSEPPGICVEGVRVRSVPAGYSNRHYSPWVFANLTGPKAPKTNVARSDVEQTPELEHALFGI